MSAWGPRAWGSASLMNQTTSSTDQVVGSLLAGALDSWDSDGALYPKKRSRKHFFRCASLDFLLQRSWFTLSRASHPSCCFLGKSLGWWMTVGTCWWKPGRWRTAARSESRKTWANTMSLWSRRPNRRDPRSSVCPQMGLGGSPQSEMFQLKSKVRLRISSKDVPGPSSGKCLGVAHRRTGRSHCCAGLWAHRWRGFHSASYGTASLESEGRSLCCSPRAGWAGAASHQM